MHRADGHAVVTANALRVGGIYRWVYAHLADVRAHATVRADILIQCQLHETDAVEQPIDGAQWTDESAEGAVHDDRRNHCRDKNACLPDKQPSCGTAQRRVQGKQGNGSLQRSCGTYELAEPWVANAKPVADEQGHEDDEDDEDGILQIAQACRADTHLA